MRSVLEGMPLFRCLLRGKILLRAQEIVQRHQAGDTTGVAVQDEDDAVGRIDQQPLHMRDGIGPQAGRRGVDLHGVETG